MKLFNQICNCFTVWATLEFGVTMLVGNYLLFAIRPDSSDKILAMLRMNDTRDIVRPMLETAETQLQDILTLNNFTEVDLFKKLAIS